MVFKSKLIHDPNGRLPGNRLGQTVGLVFYTPKFWDCRKTIWHTEPHPSLPDWYTESQRRQAERHSHCRWPHRHMSSKGYLYWVGPKRRYTLNYMGDTNPANSNPPIFFWNKHHRYVRWRDDGPQPVSNKPTKAELEELGVVFNRLRVQHEMNGCLLMSMKFARCICPRPETEESRP